MGWCHGWKASPATSLPAKRWDPRHIHFWAKKVMMIHLSGSTLQCIPLCAVLPCSTDLVVNY